MNIVILGAGAVGGTIAEVLHGHANKITIIDDNIDRLEFLKRRLDGCATVHGHAASPAILKQANTDDADMVIAVTGQDEVNIVATQIAKEVHHTPKVIIRLRSEEYSQQQEYQSVHLKNVLVINPEREVADQIEQLIQYPNALEVAQFANGQVLVVGFRTVEGYAPTGLSLAEVSEWQPTPRTRFLAIFRNFERLDLTTDAVRSGDDVYLITPKSEISTLMGICQDTTVTNRKICIAGAGHIGVNLAQRLQDHHTVRVLEQDRDQSLTASDELHDGIIYRGDATDATLHRDCEMSDTDMFIAVTNNDEINLMSCLTAKQEGAARAITLVSQDSYLRLIRQTSIDVAISPQRATASSVLSQLHEHNIQAAHRLRVGTAEVFETVLRGTSEENKVCGDKVGKLNLPPGACLGALIRDGSVLQLTDDATLNTNDHLIFFVYDDSEVPKILKNLEPSAFKFF